MKNELLNENNNKIIYISLSSDILKYAAFGNSFNVICQFETAKIIVAGDFNLPKIKWYNSSPAVDIKPLVYIPPHKLLKAQVLSQYVNLNNFHQCNPAPNIFNSYLDLIIYDIKNLKVESTTAKTFRIENYHLPLLITRYMKFKKWKIDTLIIVYAVFVSKKQTIQILYDTLILLTRVI